MVYQALLPGRYKGTEGCRILSSHQPPLNSFFGMEPTTEKVLKSSDGVEIFTEASGDPSNPHVIFVHGMSFSGAVLDQFCQREDILNSLYIVRMDMRGHGRSGKPLTSDGHLSSLYADDYKMVIEAYGLRKPIHVGWSLGGALAPDICAYLGPDTVSGLFYLSSMASVKHLWEGSATPFILEIFGRTTDPALMPQAMTEFVDACFMSDRHKPVPYSTRCLWYGMGASQPHACRVLNMQREQDTESLWRAVREGMPVCIVHGTGDVMIFPHALQDQMRAAGAKNLEVVLIPGAGHALTWEEPDTVAETLIRFSKDVWRGDKAKATKQSNL
ncbi:Alpha/Beta hydrolase protein [Amylostereum chailletii]|nr:Alpha/Beta hydrolase protein [Amylostereum chailletii]